MRVFLLTLVTALLACGDDDTRPDGGALDAGDLDAGDLDGGFDARLPDGSMADVPLTPDAGRDAGTPIGLACLGDRLPLTISRGLPFASIPVGTEASAGLFLLDLATTGSAIDLSAFDPEPMASGCDPTRLGQLCRFADLDFFGSWGTVTLSTQDLSGLGGVVEAGILGTDFFSLLTLTFDYGASEIRNAPRGTLCSDAALEEAGFASLSVEGFYSNDLSRLRPLRDVVMDASSGITVANVPTVPIRVAGVDAFAQLDTGFDDTLVPNTVNVNVAFFDAIMAADATALMRDAGNDLALSTCVVGVTENVSAYRLEEALELIGEDGTSVRDLAGVRVFVKNTPAAARRCGGIGTWSVPAAQVAASLHVALGQIVVDPFTSRVWVPTAR